MPQHPQDPHTFVVMLGGKPVAIGRAMSRAEMRDHFLASRISVERVTAAQAYDIGRNTSLLMEYAKPEYADEALNGAGLFSSAPEPSSNNAEAKAIAERIKREVELQMMFDGLPGRSDVSFYPQDGRTEYSITFIREGEDKELDVCCGGVITERRTAEDLASIAVKAFIGLLKERES